jgi:diguanylate cyclase (GGDEF)-like protein
MKVLVADDDPVTLCTLETLLHAWGHETVAATDGEAALKTLCTHDGPRLAILGRLKKPLDALGICQQLRTGQACDDYAYLLLLGRMHEREYLLQALEIGADDFVAMPLDPTELRGRLRAGERILGQYQKYLRECRELQRQATHDALTGLLNRAAALEALNRELARAAREGLSVGLGIADIDDFKRFNDVFGHQVGDQVLAETARRLKGAVRAYDTVGRYGGEEFLAVLPAISAGDLVLVAQRMRHAVSDTPVETGSRPVTVTVSIGLALGSPDTSLNPAALIHVADEALYGAKRSGRNQEVLAPPGRLMLLESSLEAAASFVPISS